MISVINVTLFVINYYHVVIGVKKNVMKTAYHVLIIVKKQKKIIHVNIFYKLIIVLKYKKLNAIRKSKFY